MALAKGNTLVYEAGKGLRGQNATFHYTNLGLMEVYLLGAVFKGGPTKARDAVVNPVVCQKHSEQGQSRER